MKMLSRFFVKTIAYFCAVIVGFFLLMPSVFAVSDVDNSSLECNYLESYISIYRDNDSSQVLKLQTFLKDQEGFDIELNGVFDPSTIIAVNEFQVRYKEDILKPWGINSPTGNVSITTRHKINDLSCGVITPLSETEKEIIRSYGVLNIEKDSDVDKNADLTEVGVINTNTHDITDINVPENIAKKELSKTKTNVSPIVTVDSLSDYFENEADNKVAKEGQANSTSSLGMVSNLSKNGVVVGIPVGFDSQFSLPILIALAALLLAQLYFFWKTPIGRKMQWVTKRF